MTSVATTLNIVKEEEMSASAVMMHWQQDYHDYMEHHGGFKDD